METRYIRQVMADFDNYITQETSPTKPSLSEMDKTSTGNSAHDIIRHEIILRVVKDRDEKAREFTQCRKILKALLKHQVDLYYEKNSPRQLLMIRALTLFFKYPKLFVRDTWQLNLLMTMADGFAEEEHNIY